MEIETFFYIEQESVLCSWLTILDGETTAEATAILNQKQNGKAMPADIMVAGQFVPPLASVKISQTIYLNENSHKHYCFQYESYFRL